MLVGGRFFGHYFHQLTAPLAVLAAPYVVRLRDRWPTVLRLGMGVPAILFLAAGVLHAPIMRWIGDPDPDYARVATWIEEHSTRQDPICIWGNSPVLYFDTDRPLGCRFVFANYLTGLSPATRTQTDPDFDASANVVPQAWEMLFADLHSREPLFIIDASPGDVGHYGKFPPGKFPRLEFLLDQHYTAVAEVEHMTIWRRRSESGATAERRATPTERPMPKDDLH